jgi:hypothetical protein
MRRVLFLLALAVSFAASAKAQSSKPTTKGQTSPPAVKPSAPPSAVQAARASFAKPPLAFEENAGQTDARVKYTSRGAGYDLFLTADEAVLALRGGNSYPNCVGAAKRTHAECANSKENPPEASVLWMKMLGANPAAQIAASDLLPGKTNYYIGNDPSKWRIGVRQFGRVSYKGIYPGVDLTYYGSQQQLESDFVIEPGASSRSVEFEITGAKTMRLDAQGNLLLATSAGEVRLLRPGVYQMVSGARREVAGRYVLLGKNRIGFEIGRYDNRSALVIDPVFLYSTYLGGSGGDAGNAIAIDPSGDAFVTGSGFSFDFPGAASAGPVSQLQFTGYAFVTKFDPTGNNIVYSTLLRGTGFFGTDSGNGIGIDSAGNAYVAGTTSAPDFPLLNPFQATIGDDPLQFETLRSIKSGFVAGLDTNGALIYSTFFGGRNDNDQNFLTGLAADSAGNAYVAGYTNSKNFPTVNPLQSTNKGFNNAVVAKFNGQGQLVYSTYLGGGSDDQGNAIAIDGSGNAYVTGQTSSSDFPVQAAPAPFQSTQSSFSTDAFVSKLSFDSVHQTLSLANSTYLGGDSTDVATGIAVDAATPPNVYLTGQTSSTNAPNTFPTKNPIFAATPGATEAFVTKLKGDFTTLVYSTFLGGTGASGDEGFSIALDGANPPNAFVTGETFSSDFPVALPLQSSTGSPSDFDAFVAEVNGAGSALTYSTYLGGLGTDIGLGIAVDSAGNAYVTGSTTSANFPVLSSSGVATRPFQDHLHTSSGNAFLTKISPSAAAAGLNFFPPVFTYPATGINDTGLMEAFTVSNNSGSSVTVNSFSIGGTNPGDFKIVGGSSTCSTGGSFALAAGASCVLAIQFVPQDQDTRSAQLSVSSTPSSSSVANLSGFGAVPEISLNPTTINYGTSLPLNVPAFGSVSITNTGAGTLHVGSAQLTGADVSSFTIASNSCSTVPAHSSCFISVTLTPTTAKAYSGTLLINDDAAGSPQSVALSGTGVAQVTVIPTSIEFGGWLLNTSSPDREIFVTNGSGGVLTLSSITPSGNSGDFPTDTSASDTSRPDCVSGLSMQPGTSCGYSLFFKPTTGTAFDGDTATYTFNWTGALSGSKAVTVMGTGETGVILYKNSFTAPSEFVGATERQSDFDQIFNGTASPVTITSIVLSGPAAQDYKVELDNSCSVNGTIAANSVCFLDGSFSPTATGTRSATATITYTGSGGGSLVLNVTGIGLAGPVQFPSNFDFGSEIVGVTGAVQRIYLQNAQKLALNISSVSAIGGTNAGDFVVNLSTSTCKTGQIKPGGKCFLDLQFAPTAAGSRTATITITDDGPGSPRTLNMTGTGVTGADSISVTPNALDFGNVPLVNPSSAQPTLTAVFYLTNGTNASTTINVAPALTNAGTAFGLNGASTTCKASAVVLPQGGTCSVAVTFTPTTPGLQTNSVTLTDATGGLHTVTVQGTGVNQGVLSVTPALGFNQTPNTTSAAQTVTVTNNGTGPLTITVIAVNGKNPSNFAISNSGTTCAVGTSLPAAPGPGNTCTIAVTFTAPVAPGSFNANLLVSANLGNNATGNGNTTLTGSSLGLSVTPTPPLDFGTVPVGTTINYSTLINSFIGVTLTNNFASSITVTNIAPQTAGDFTVVNNGCTFALSPGNSCNFDITFTPTVTSAESNNILVTYTGGPGSPFAIAVKGTGSAALLAVPNPLNVTTAVGTPASPTITLGNGTSTTINIVSVNAITGTNASDYSMGFSACSFTPSLSPAGSPFGSSCTIGITFNPLAPGASRTAQFTVTYTVGVNPAQQTLTVNLNGTATAAQISLSPNPPTPLTFGLQLTNTQSLVLNVVVTNSGNAPLNITNLAINGPNAVDFALAPQAFNFPPVSPTTGCQSEFSGLAPGTSCTIPITFTPTLLYNSSTRNATLTITDNAFPSTTQSVPLAGNMATGNLTVSPSSLSFPDTNVGSSVTETVLLTNTTNASVTFTSVSFGTASYSVDASQTLNACSSSKPLSAFTGSCTVYIKFTPALGANPDTATIHTSAGNPTVTLSGNGKSASVTVSPNPLTFSPGQLVNTTSSPLTVTLTNGTASSITISGTPTITGANAGDFALSAGGTCSGTVTAGNTCIVNVTFTAKAAGARTATLTISASDANSPHQVTLNGTGLQPGASLSSATMSFGTITLNATSGQQTVTLTNNGNATLNVSNVQLGGTNAGDFALATPASGTDCRTAGTVAAGGNCVVAATFTPTALNARSATITITDDASPTTQVINLSGSGGAPSVTFNPTTIAFGNQRVNSPSNQMTSTLTNAGTVSLTITNVALGGTNSGDFSLVAPNSGTDCRTIGTVPAGGNCVLAATFTPSATGARSATVTFTDNSNPTTQVLNLSGTGTFPQATPTPSPLAFGNQRENTTSSAHTLTLTNGGTGTLNVSSVVLGGANASDFAITSNGCTGAVAAGGNCTVQLTFKPTTLTAESATLTFTDDASPTTQVVNLTGTGVFPQATPTPSPLAFGNQRENTTSSAHTLTLTNGGTGTLNVSSVILGGANASDFAITSNGCTGAVAAGGNCAVQLTFKPTTLTAESATITFTDDASPTTQVVNLTGTGVFPQASAGPGALAFGNQTTGTTSAPQTVTLTNGGTDVLQLTTVALGGSNPSAFAMANGSTCTTVGTVNAGSSCVVNVTFTPSSTTSFSATLTFSDNASPATQVVNLTGTGVTSTVLFNPSTIAFGNQRQGVPSAQMTSTLSNTGSTTLTISNVTIGGANGSDFAFATPGSGADCRTAGTVAAGSSCVIATTFTPGGLGARSATVSVADSAAGSPHTLSLTGTGVFPQATPTPSPLAFANQIINTTSGPQTLTLTNGGTDTLNIKTVALGGANPGQFAIAAGTTCTNGATVAANSTCVVNLTFTPNSATSFAATLTFTDDASPTTQTVNLSSTGVTPPTATLSANTISFGNRRVNTASTAQSVTITNNGGAPLNITSSTLTGTNSSDFSFGPATTCPTSASGQVAPNGGSCTLSIIFTPGAINARSAAINIAVTQIANPAPITLSGTGIAPAVTFAPTSVAFGNQEVSTKSAAQTGTLTNSGTDVLHITAAAITGANASDFAIVPAGTSCATGLPAPVSVAASANCGWSVTFTPTGLGSRTASLTFTDDSGATTGSTQSVPLSGTGTAPVVVLAPTTVSFPAQAVSTTSAAMNGTLTNTGTTALHLASVSITGANAGDFAIVSSGTTCTNGSTVAASTGSCTWSVTFTPTAAGTRSASLTFTDDNNGVSGSTQSVALTGITPPAATLSTNSISFSNQAVGTASSPSSITLSNPGGSTLHITTVAISGTNASDYAVATSGTTCTNGSTVAPNASCVINVTFTPGAAGARGPATLTVTDDATPTTQTVSLSGSGISFSLSLSAQPTPQTAGTPITATIQLTPGSNGFPNPVTFSVSNLPPDTTGAFSQTTVTPGNSVVTTTLTLTTHARSGGSEAPGGPSRGPISGGWIATALLALLAMTTLRRGIRVQRVAYLPLAVLLLGAAIITGCTTTKTGTPAGTYNVSVTATSGSYTQSTQVAIVVK